MYGKTKHLMLVLGKLHLSEMLATYISIKAQGQSISNKSRFNAKDVSQRNKQWCNGGSRPLCNVGARINERKGGEGGGK